MSLGILYITLNIEAFILGLMAGEFKNLKWFGCKM